MDIINWNKHIQIATNVKEIYVMVGFLGNGLSIYI